jgi:hypothetical protein
MKIYDYLLTNLNIPIVTGSKAGGRVITKLNMMPSIIRQLVKINGSNINECDYSTLHPNLANMLYGDSKDKITHDNVAEYLNISRNDAKIEHLSFFNKRISSMKKSPLYNYYNNKHNTLLTNVINDKKEFNHYITSRKLFSLETQLMEECILIAEKMDIKVIYVFDALYCDDNNKITLNKIMNEVLINKNK